MTAVDQNRRRYRILRNTNELVAMRPEWDRLWAESGAEYYLSFPSMLQSWTTIHRPQGAALRCAIACDGQRLLAVLPMVSHRHKLWQTASTCGPRASESCDILVAHGPESQEIASALFERFLALARPDYVEFEFVKLESHLEIAIRNTPNLHVTKTWDAQIPYADLKAESDWQAYRDSLNKGYRGDCARAMRRLNEQGTVTVEVVNGMSTPLIDWLFLHKQRWSERTNKRGDWVFSTAYQEFLRLLFSSDPRYLVFALKLNEVPIAVKLVAINATSATCVMTTYDERYRRFSPGKLLAESLMQHIFENYRGADGRHLDINFGPGMEGLKLHWSRGNTHPARAYQIVVSRWGAMRLRVKHAIGADAATDNAASATP
jgi:CelD/BcsL family acetyltransferase involved in cellulose biosynthesis